jgi:hypothetical protein
MSHLLCVLLSLVIAATVQAADWPAPHVQLPKDLKHPYVACTPQELSRIKAAFEGEGRPREIVAGACAETRIDQMRALLE